MFYPFAKPSAYPLPQPCKRDRWKNTKQHISYIKRWISALKRCPYVKKNFPNIRFRPCIKHKHRRSDDTETKTYETCTKNRSDPIFTPLSHKSTSFSSDTNPKPHQIKNTMMCLCIFHSRITTLITSVCKLYKSHYKEKTAMNQS